MKRPTLIIALLLSLCAAANAQEQLTQTIRGIVRDEASSSPIPFAAVTLPDIPDRGVVCNGGGLFSITNVPLGRHTIRVSMVGYETVTLREILLTSGKELYMEISMKEQVQRIDQIVVRPRVNKEEAINTTATTGARMMSMEEANRYAGGVDDPARLVAAFSGVASRPSVNGISVHGNSPEMLQWRLEGIEIPTPNHYADITTLGGGVLSSLSSHVLGNSDFFSGAFPAEYGNAIAGVFDIRMRTGNSHRHEHTVQVGLMGVDVASEGPFGSGGNSSYLFNYRYSSLGIISRIDPSLDLGGVFDYQDLNFKLNFNAGRAGSFTLWGTGLTDLFADDSPKEPSEWEYAGDNSTSEAEMHMGAAGVGHTYRFGAKGYLKTTLAATSFRHTARQESIAQDLSQSPLYDLRRSSTNLVLTSAYNHKFGAAHSNRTGFTYKRIIYDMDFGFTHVEGQPLETISRGSGATGLISAYSNSTVNISNRLTANIGVNSQVLTLNDSWSVEPRAGIKYLAGDRTTLALAYGLNSRMAKMDIYYVRTGGNSGEPVNTGLGFTKAHHLMFTYSYRINDNTLLRVEPYYQHLFGIPVEEGTSYSEINRQEYGTESVLVNRGTGRNYGADLTLEQYLAEGFYYMFTGSVFDSKYRGGDGILRDTRYNRNYILNGLAGKEWMTGHSRRNTVNANIKLTLQGGERYTPVDEAATLAHPDKTTQYDEARAFSMQYEPMFLVNLSAGYRINRPKATHEFGLAVINLAGAPEHLGFFYNHRSGSMEDCTDTNSFKNIYYRINF